MDIFKRGSDMSHCIYHWDAFNKRRPDWILIKVMWSSKEISESDYGSTACKLSYGKFQHIEMNLGPFGRKFIFFQATKNVKTWIFVNRRNTYIQ